MIVLHGRLRMKGWKKNQWFLAYAFVAIIGTIFHFMYGWLQENKIAGYFFPVNESTWEHMKLVYFPMLLCGWIFVKRLSAQWLLGILVGTWLIPVLFYTYRGVLGVDIAAFDIGTFFIAVAGAFWSIYHTLEANWGRKTQRWLKIFVVVQGVLFVIFTYYPLNFGIFWEP